MSDRTELLAKASELGLTYPKNIATLKLEELIISTLEAEVTPKPVKEVIPEPVEELPTERMSKLELRRKVINDAKAKAFATQIVTITNRDNRENDFMTTAYLSFENQFFGISKLVPLDMPVELEQALIDIAESTTIVLHKDEIVDGKRTGNKIATQVKKFAVSYNK